MEAEAEAEADPNRPGRVLAYGEDPLAFFALSHCLTMVLLQLRDPTPPGEAILVVRPGFGRHGKTGEVHGSGAARAEFGDLDAILGTKHAIYLIENKWSVPGEVKAPTFAMREDQLHRHRILRWYLDAWRSRRPASWASFVAEHDRDFRLRFPGGRMAADGSVLASGLQFLLSELDGCGAPVRDVLLYMRARESPPPPKTAPHGFALVTVTVDSLHANGFFEMGRP
jgi:hypothetical protein